MLKALEGMIVAMAGGAMIDETTLRMYMLEDGTTFVWNNEKTARVRLTAEQWEHYCKLRATLPADKIRIHDDGSLDIL